MCDFFFHNLLQLRLFLVHCENRFVMPQSKWLQREKKKKDQRHKSPRNYWGLIAKTSIQLQVFTLGYRAEENNKYILCRTSVQFIKTFYFKVPENSLLLLVPQRLGLLPHTKEGPEFKSQLKAFLHGVCKLSPCLHGNPLGAPVPLPPIKNMYARLTSNQCP